MLVDDTDEISSLIELLKIHMKYKNVDVQIFDRQLTLFILCWYTGTLTNSECGILSGSALFAKIKTIFKDRNIS